MPFCTSPNGFFIKYIHYSCQNMSLFLNEPIFFFFFFQCLFSIHPHLPCCIVTKQVMHLPDILVGAPNPVLQNMRIFESKKSYAVKNLQKRKQNSFFKKIRTIQVRKNWATILYCTRSYPIELLLLSFHWTFWLHFFQCNFLCFKIEKRLNNSLNKISPELCYSEFNLNLLSYSFAFSCSQTRPEQDFTNSVCIHSQM